MYFSVNPYALLFLRYNSYYSLNIHLFQSFVRKLQDGLVWWHVHEWGMPLYPYLFFSGLIMVILFFGYRLYNSSPWEVLGWAGIMTVEFFLVNGIVIVRNFIVDDLIRNLFLIRWLITVGVDGFFTLTCLGMAVVGTPFIVIMSFLPTVGADLLHASAQIGKSAGTDGDKADERTSENDTVWEDVSDIYPPHLYSGTVCYGRKNRYGWGAEYVNENDDSDRIVITNIYSQTGSEMDTNAGHFTF